MSTQGRVVGSARTQLRFDAIGLRGPFRLSALDQEINAMVNPIDRLQNEQKDRKGDGDGCHIAEGYPTESKRQRKYVSKAPMHPPLTKTRQIPRRSLLPKHMPVTATLETSSMTGNQIVMASRANRRRSAPFVRSAVPDHTLAADPPLQWLPSRQVHPWPQTTSGRRWLEPD